MVSQIEDEDEEDILKQVFDDKNYILGEILDEE